MDESAAGSVVAFLFAGIIFVAAIGSVLVTTSQVGEAGTVDATETAKLKQQADALLDILLGSPGYAQYVGGAPRDWLDDEAGQGAAADSLQRLGLLEPGVPAIDFQKLANLRGAPYDADATDGFVNYEEALAAMGLDALGLDFHIRAHPSLKTVAELLETTTKDTNLRVAYIGDADTAAQQELEQGGTPPDIQNLQCAIAPHDNRAVRLTMDIVNHGDVTTQFHGILTITQGTTTIDDTQQTPSVASAGTTTLTVDVPALDGECDAITNVDVSLHDPSAEVATYTFTDTFSAVGASVAANAFRVDPSANHFTTADTVIIAYEGDLDYEQGQTNGETMTLEILDGGVDVLPATVTNPVNVPKQNEDWVFDGFPASDLGVGTYEIKLTRGNGEVVTDTLVIETSALPNYDPPGGGGAGSHVYSDAASIEVEFLESLVHRFCPFVWDSTSDSPMTTPPGWSARCEHPIYPAHNAEKAGIGHFGDVFPDDNDLLKEELDDRLLNPDGTARLDITNTLVVGSNVDHNTMTANAIKSTIKDWVLGGGTLIVFGSENQVVNWLQPILNAKLESSSGGLSTPDSAHPLLHVADTLNWDAYDDRGRAWNLQDNGGNAAAFTRVVEDDSDDSVLAISDPGAYGTGNVILTSWLPYDLFGDGSNANEGLLVINNLLMQGYRDVFLDYGPEIPDGVSVIPAMGRAQVYHPELERHIAMDIILFVFPSG